MVAKRNRRQSRNGRLGLLANGSCGQWEIAIDETTSGPDHWYAELEGPGVSFYFELPSLDIVGKMARLLAPPALHAQKLPHGSGAATNVLMIGKDKKAPFSLVKDDEYKDRVFLVVGPPSSPLVRFVFAGTDLTCIAKALEQVLEDLDNLN